MFIYSSAKVNHPHIDRPTPAVPGYTRPREDWKKSHAAEMPQYIIRKPYPGSRDKSRPHAAGLKRRNSRCFAARCLPLLIANAHGWEILLKDRCEIM